MAYSQASQASTHPSQSWFSSGILGTKASSLLTTVSLINPYFLSDETRDSILALFAGRDAKFRMERKRMLAHFRSLPNPAQSNFRLYEDDHAWAAAIGGSQTGRKVVDGVIYRYRLSPDLSPDESYSSSYIASGFTSTSNCVDVKVEHTDQHLSQSPSKTCEPCYSLPARSTTPKPLEARGFCPASSFQFSNWIVDLDYNKSLYKPSSPIPSARDVSTVDYKLPGKIPSLDIIVEQPEKHQHDPKDLDTPSALTTPLNPPIILAKEVAHQEPKAAGEHAMVRDGKREAVEVVEVPQSYPTFSTMFSLDALAISAKNVTRQKKPILDLPKSETLGHTITTPYPLRTPAKNLKPKTASTARSNLSENGKNSKTNNKSKTAGGYAMMRERKRRPVEGRGRGVKAITPLRVNLQPLVIRNEPIPDVPENAIVDTDSEDDWDPTCFIEPVKKPRRYNLEFN